METLEMTYDEYIIQNSRKQLDSKNNFGIILDRVKNQRNIGVIMRTIANFSPSFIATVGFRYRRSCGDTINTPQSVPYFSFGGVEDCLNSIPGWEKIAVELTDEARDMRNFVHPKRAIYIFGPEDGSVQPQFLKRCKYKVFVPTYQCMNLGISVGVTMYDRLSKC